MHLCRRLINLLVFLFMRLQCRRRGAAGPASATVTEENLQPSFPPLAPALPWCEDWTACQVRWGSKSTRHSCLLKTLAFEDSTAQRTHTQLLDLSNLPSNSKPTIWLHFAQTCSARCVCECDGREGPAPVCARTRMDALASRFDSAGRTCSTGHPLRR